MINYIFLSIHLLFGIYCHGDIYKEINKNIRNEQLSNSPDNTSLIKKFYLIRNRNEIIRNINISGNDTLFILETFNHKTGDYVGSIWNNRLEINYTYRNKTLILHKNPYFIKHMYKLISSWDTNEIRHEETINSSSIDPLTIYGTKIIVVNDIIDVSCIKFNEFFNFQRDKQKYNTPQ